MQLSSPQPEDLAAVASQRAELCSDAQRPVVALRAKTRQLSARWSVRRRSQVGDGQTCAREIVAEQAGANRAGAGEAGSGQENVDQAGGGSTGCHRAGVGQLGVEQALVRHASVEQACVGQASIKQASVERVGVGQVGAGQTTVERLGVGQAGAGHAARDPANQAALDLADCGALMRGGSRTFFAASLLLPRRVCAPATALYAFCRLADDAIDDAPTGDAATGIRPLDEVSSLSEAIDTSSSTDRAIGHGLIVYAGITTGLASDAPGVNGSIVGAGITTGSIVDEPSVNDSINSGAAHTRPIGDSAIDTISVLNRASGTWSTDESARKQNALRTLRRRLDLAYAGAPADLAADRAFAAAAARHHVPRALPEALLEGFAWDAEGRRYEDLAALHAYAARVAGTVGAMMAVLMGVRGRDALARACELGIAMQLTNIARDVGSDARAGRIYLPLSWLRRESIDPEAWLANPVFTPALGRVVQRLLAEATALYESAASGLACLPADCRPAIRAAGLIYAEIGQEIAAAGYDSVSRRARVTGSRKAALILRSLAAVRPRVLHARAPGLPEAQFLVDAAFAEKAATRRFAPARAVETRVLWLLDLFEQLDQRRLEAP